MFDWFNRVNVRLYLGQAMTGLRQDLIYKHNIEMTEALELHGIIVLSPVTEEGVQPNKRKLDQPSQEQLANFWQRDKELIRSSHLLLDITGTSVSEGLKHEIGLVRYFLFKPVVRILELKGPSVAIEEDDILVKDIEEAAKLIIEKFGTPKKRLLWKYTLFRRCFLPYLKTRLFWCFDWI